MKREIDQSTGGRLPITILGVNAEGFEAGNASICTGRSIPWLQDVADQDVWYTKWTPTYRDVVVLGQRNRKIAVYNLTVHDLGNATYFNELKNMLIQAATDSLD